MDHYALVRPDNSIDRIKSENEISPNVQTKEGWRWLLVVPLPMPEFDTATQVLVGPAFTTLPTTVEKSFTVRDKTATELDNDKEQAIDKVDMLAFKVLFNHENRIRTLENRPAVTANEFRTLLKGLV